MDSGQTFNTPLEAGLRTLFVLAAAGRRSFDGQRLVYFDYMLVHSGDLGGAKSLHPTAPAQKGELLVRRQLVQSGLALMRSRELVERRFATTGIVYSSTSAGRHVVDQFDSAYADELRKRAGWVVETFGAYTDRGLAGVLRATINDWDDELIHNTQPQTGWGSRA